MVLYKLRRICVNLEKRPGGACGTLVKIDRAGTAARLNLHIFNSRSARTEMAAGIRRGFMRIGRALIAAAVAGLAAAAAVGASLPQRAAPEAYVLTVDGSPVCEEEFLLMLRENRTVYEGELREELYIPGDRSVEETLGEKRFQRLLLEKNIAYMTSLRTEQALGLEYGVLSEAFTYDGFLTALEEENHRREARLAAGEPVYGLRRFTPEQYYGYHMDALRTDLLAALPEEVLGVKEADVDACYQSIGRYAQMDGETVDCLLCDVTAARDLPASEQEALYADITDMLAGRGGGFITRAGVTYTAEEKTLTSAQLRELIRQSFDAEFLLAMSPGEISAPFPLGERTYIVRYLGFDKAEALTESERAVLRLRLEEEAYRQLLAERTRTAGVRVNQEYLDAYLAEGGEPSR